MDSIRFEYFIDTDARLKGFYVTDTLRPIQRSWKGTP